jgi:type I restriction-modification system DNA methylase subunit
MALFQNSVLNKYLSNQDKQLLAKKWIAYKNHFLNSTVQENIRSSKEEQYQGEFIIDLFVNVLGYTKNPNPDFNITTEIKNVKDSKKADGGILIDNQVIGVIELKGTKTTDFDKIEKQAFGYKNNQPNCVYVITSNFEKLRFYIDNAIEYQTFNLFQMTEKEFELLYLCLAFENIKNGIPKQLKQESLSQEDQITKQLYKDYSAFKSVLYQNLRELNPQFDGLELLKYTQKLLDRFLFLFFAEDRQLLPPNSVRLIISDWKDLAERDVEMPLYDRFKKYFEYLNEGSKRKRYDVFAYNGGLFQPNAVLDNLKIDDNLLAYHTQKLADYDFLSEVDVNILGHIFENSLNEMDEIKAQTEGTTLDKTQTKRKKDGIFYTPKYITNYIIENTVGKLCTEKKTEIMLAEEDYFTDKKRPQKAKQALLEKIETYRNWLLQITIIDPACGSGAFLNEALNFLIKEHLFIDELQSKLFGDALVLSDVQKSILENNLFGVDLNDESVEIAKLSLWLRTAQPNRKLNNLNNNIKCGNSLIDDPLIAGENAFNWQTEFPQVFAKGGFDVVIGNPPYGAKLDTETQNYLNKTYIKGGSETVISFTKLSYDTLLKQNGKLGFIIPKSFTFSSNYEGIREYVFDDIYEIIDCKKVWKEVQLEQIIFFFEKNNKTQTYKTGKLQNNEITIIGLIEKENYKIFGFYLNDISNAELNIGLKIKKAGIYLKDIAVNSRGGIFQNKISEKGNTEVLGGAEIQRNGVVGIKGKIDIELIKNDAKCFIANNSVLVQNIVAHIENPTDHIKITACLPINRNYAIVDTINQLTFTENYNPKVFWILLNSKLINWYCYRFIYARAIRTMHFDNSITNRIPIPKEINQTPFIDMADDILEHTTALQTHSARFLKLLQSSFPNLTVNKKIENWHDMTFGAFRAALEQQKIKIPIKELMDYQDLFETNAALIKTIQSKISATDAEIDQMVYALYGLTPDEIAVIERG